MWPQRRACRLRVLHDNIHARIWSTENTRACNVWCNRCRRGYHTSQCPTRVAPTKTRVPQVCTIRTPKPLASIRMSSRALTVTGTCSPVSLRKPENVCLPRGKHILQDPQASMTVNFDGGACFRRGEWVDGLVRIIRVALIQVKWRESRQP